MRIGICILVLFFELFLSESVRSFGAELPVKFSEGFLWVEVTVPERSDPLNFLLDSGASSSVLNLDTARSLGLKLGSKVSVTGVHTRITGHWPVRLQAEANHIALPDQYLAIDLSKLSGTCRCSVDGLLGADFFRSHIVQVDYARQKLTLLEKWTASSTEDTLALEVRPCGFRVKASVNHEPPQWFRLDTGCATALQWVRTSFPSDSCTKIPAVGLSELSVPQMVTSVSIGGAVFGSVPTGVHTQTIFQGESGLIGNELLARFGVVTIDAPGGRLILSRPGVK